MKSLKEFSDLYPSDEKILWEENQVLMKDLKANLSALASNKYEKELVKVLNPDGFYPYYTHQIVKILFIAKESLGLYGKDYIQAILPAIRVNDPRGRREWNESHPDDPWTRVITNNTDPFLSKMLYIAYGLNNACCSYDDMPWASDIGQYLFGRANGIVSREGEQGISYAFMNYSKFDNPSEESYAADKNRMRTYFEMVQRSGINWFARQISLLNPDLIIEMNIGRQYADSLSTKPIEWVETEDENLWIGYLPIGEQKFLLFETWHFSIPGKSFNKHFYPNIVDAWVRYGTKG